MGGGHLKMAMKDKKWSDKDLSLFKDLILDKKDATNEELQTARDRTEKMRDASKNNAIYSSHMADASGDHVELEKAYYMIARLEKYLNYLAKALEMIADGTFGICISCNNMIPKARLEEVPHTTKCVDCKEGI